MWVVLPIQFGDPPPFLWSVGLHETLWLFYRASFQQFYFKRNSVEFQELVCTSTGTVFSKVSLSGRNYKYICSIGRQHGTGMWSATLQSLLAAAEFDRCGRCSLNSSSTPIIESTGLLKFVLISVQTNEITGYVNKEIRNIRGVSDDSRKE